MSTTLAFLDHSFHEKTRSLDFLVQAWADYGWTVQIFYDDEWRGGPGVAASEIKKAKPDIVLSFQVLKPAAYYRETGCNQILLVPMYDSSGGMKPWDWWEYREFTFLHFSQALHHRTNRLGIPGVYLQYFPDITLWETKPWVERQGDVFFWQRKQEIPAAKVIAFIEASWPQTNWTLHWHNVADPGEAPVAPSGNRVTVKESHWFPDKAAHDAVVADQKVYIAPRLAEGIGHSYLEAMAVGCVVVGNRNATMSEYIRHGKNGLLVNWKRPRSRRISDERWRALGEAARQSVAAGRLRYEASLQELMNNWDAVFAKKTRWTTWNFLVGLAYWLRLRVIRPIKRIFRREA